VRSRKELERVITTGTGAGRGGALSVLGAFGRMRVTKSPEKGLEKRRGRIWREGKRGNQGFQSGVKRRAGRIRRGIRRVFERERTKKLWERQSNQM